MRCVLAADQCRPGWTLWAKKLSGLQKGQTHVRRLGTVGRLSVSSLLLLFFFSPTLLSTGSRKAGNERRRDADDDGDSRAVVYDDTSFDFPRVDEVIADNTTGWSGVARRLPCPLSTTTMIGIGEQARERTTWQVDEIRIPTRTPRILLVYGRGAPFWHVDLAVGRVEMNR